LLIPALLEGVPILEVNGMKKGFTLIELLLVVTILGILAAIAVPKLFPQSERARAAEAVGILQAIRQGEQAYQLENGQYLDCPGVANCWSNLGMEDPNSTAKYFSYRVVEDNSAVPVSTFEATATRNNIENPGGQFNGSIIIDQNGNFSGTHKFKPS
jgi:prepilin-type N-terminal cleavage/methylation domain-containing protein